MGLDYDHTIVKPKNNKTFPKDIDDWECQDQMFPKLFKITKWILNCSIYKSLKNLKRLNQNVMDQQVFILCLLAYDKTIKKPSPFLYEQYKRSNIDLKNHLLAMQ